MDNWSETQSGVRGDALSLEEVMDTSYDSIFVTDATGNILLVNPTAERLLNLPAKKMLGKNVRELVESGCWDRSVALEAIEKKTTVTGVIKTCDGVHLMCTSRPIFDAGGNVTMVISNSRDQDALVKLARTLETERRLAQRYRDEVHYLREERFRNKHLVAESRAMKDLLLEADLVAPTDTSILLYGESGTGKEVLARYIYTAGSRAREAFITVNCSAIPESLIEAELFGYEKGSFTGADAKGKPGLFELADNGTIFLDEIGEMPLVLQAKLLRVLESGEVRRIGGTATRTVNFRLICATNRDLKAMVAERAFRKDLFYRISVVPLHVTPLRERPEDITVMSRLFLGDINKRYGYDKVFSAETLNGFLRYNWPGNVRELRNLIERLAITARGRVIEYQFEDVADPLPHAGADSRDANGENGAVCVTVRGTEPLKEIMNRFEKHYVERVFHNCRGCVSETARILGIDRSAVYRKIGVTGLRKTGR